MTRGNRIIGPYTAGTTPGDVATVPSNTARVGLLVQCSASYVIIDERGRVGPTLPSSYLIDLSGPECKSELWIKAATGSITVYVWERLR